MTKEIDITEASKIRLSEIARLKKEVGNLKLQLEVSQGKHRASCVEIVTLKMRSAQFKRGVYRFLRDMDKGKKETSEIRDIQEKVCAFYMISLKRLTDHGRKKRDVQARHIAMYLCREANFSFPDIGEAFGNRNHTTVMHAVKKVASQEDLKLKAEEVGKDG